MIVFRSPLMLLPLAAAMAIATAHAGPPSPPVAIYGTGLDTDGGKIFRILLNSDNKSELFATLAGGDPSTGTTSPNGIAVDQVRGLIYYSVDDDAVASTPDKLYSIPLDTPVGTQATPTLRGTVVANTEGPTEQVIANGAAMYEGDYYYLQNRTNKWYKAALDDDGNVVSNDIACTAGDATGYGLGDITGLQGVLYGSVRDIGAADSPTDTEFKFISLDLETCVLQEFNQVGLPRQMQLAWGVDYELYGYDPDDELLYLIDKDDGTRTSGPDYTTGTGSLGLVGMSDIDSLPPEARVLITKKTNGTDNPNPDDDDTVTGPEVTIGSEVEWTYEIENGGQLALTNVTVEDDMISEADIRCDDNGDGEIKAGDGETDNIILTLAVGDSTFCEATGTATAGQYVNVGTATADYVSQFNPAGDTVTDSDDDRYYGIEDEESHDVALLVIDRDSINRGERCHKHRHKRHHDRDDDDGHKHSKGEKCYSDHKNDRDDDDDGHRSHRSSRYAETLNSGSSGWTSEDLGTPASGKRNILPYFANPANFGTELTLVTGSVDKSRKDESSEGWFAPDCIPQKWLSGASGSDNTCMTGDNRQDGIDNFFFNGTTPYTGAPSSTSIHSSRLKEVPSVLPLRARGLKLLEGVKVCAVVYADDVEVSYKHKDGKKYDYDKRDRDDDDDGKRRGERCGDKYDSDRYSSSHHRGGDYNGPLIRADLSGKTYGIVAFEVIEARDRSCKDCLPEVDVEILDPAETCNSLLLYNAPVPNGPKYPKDLVTVPLYDQTGYKKYRSLYYDAEQDLLF